MKLELKHWLSYLPYKVKFYDERAEIIWRLLSFDLYGGDITFYRRFSVDKTSINYLNEDFSFIKPILRPLSDLTKEITHNGETFVPLIKLKNSGTDLNEIRYKDYQKCYSIIDNEEHELCFYIESNSFHKYYRGGRTN